MLAGALETYSATLIVIVASTALGAGICAAGGARRWTWAAPAVGLAAITMLAWWAVRLPGEGLTALLAIAVAALLGGGFALRRLDGLGEAARRGAPVLIVALAAVSLPFAVEGHFGVLGTGFNVDMSQHLFAADWLADPAGPAAGLFEQGYPLGPHALAVATGEISGELATAFSGVTIAAPILLALTALGACEGLKRSRATVVAILAAFAYLAASYLAQGSFKELYEATFLIGFALWLRELSRGGVESGWRAGLPLAVLGAGALYAYSAPGLAWLAGALVLWGVAALTIGRKARDTVANPPMRLVRSAAPAVLAGVAALLLLAAPELDRITDFGGSVGTVSDRAGAAAEDSLRAEAPPPGTDQVQVGIGERGSGPERPQFDNDLGNLFGQISPLEALGVWPSGDFRVAPGDGAIPAFVFYLGALLGALALALGIAAAFRRGEAALLAALAAAVAIWLAARIASTPYTTAKALQMVAPVAMLIAARGLLDPRFSGALRSRPAALRALLAAAFIAAAGLSGGLALAKAPVGPTEYDPGVFALSDRFAGRSVLLLVDEETLADEHGEEFYGWELREASSFEIEAAPAAPTARPPAPTDLVLQAEGSQEPPYPGLEKVVEADDAVLWQTPSYYRIVRCEPHSELPACRPFRGAESRAGSADGP